jgi:REP-associated tyrosine transposase
MRVASIVIVVTVTRKVRRYSGGVYDLGLHVVWCPKYRRRVLGGRVAVRLRELIEAKAAEKGWEIIATRVLRSEFPHLKSQMPTPWSSSFFVASVGAVSADTVEKYINTQWERPWTKKQEEGQA